jgi:uncharacterized protein YkwD
MFKHLAAIILGMAVLAGCQQQAKVDLLVSLPTSISGKQNTPATPRTLAALEQATYQQVNQYRRRRNLPPLKLNARISQEARIHSQRMAAKITPFSHQGFEERVKALAAVLPLQKAGENLAFNQGYGDPVTKAVQGWIDSPGHRQNMEGDFNLTGIGVVQNRAGEYYLTQIFLKQQFPGAGLPAYGNAATTDSALLPQLEQKIHNRVNQYRLSHGLPPLRLDARISYEARRHSQAMARGTAAFSHDGFANRVKAIGASIPYRKAGENLAEIQGYPDLIGTAVQGWIDSPGHRKNMEGDFNLTGVGAARNLQGKYYFTQIFVRER